MMHQSKEIYVSTDVGAGLPANGAPLLIGFPGYAVSAAITASTTWRSRAPT